MAKYESVDTVIDRFLEYVEANGKTPLSRVASSLGITAAQAERLSVLLEQSGFLEVHYGLGEAMVSVTKKKEEKQQPVGQKSKPIIESKELELQVLASENLLKFFEKDIFRRIAIADNLLGELQRNPEYSVDEITAVEREVDLALGQLAAFSQEVKTLADQEEHFYNKLVSFKQKLAALKAAKKTGERISLLQRIIAWIKGLFHRQKPLVQRAAPRKKKRYDKLHGVTFLGKGESAEKRAVKLQSGQLKRTRHLREKRVAR